MVTAVSGKAEEVGAGLAEEGLRHPFFCYYAPEHALSVCTGWQGTNRCLPTRLERRRS